MLSALVLGLVLAVTAHGERAASEYQIKAAYLFNFTQFVQWPSNAFVEANAPLTIGIVGEDPFGSALEDITRGEKVAGHPLVIKHLKAADDLSACQILFISRSEKDRADSIVESLRGKPVLTVSELDQFGQRGGIIRFVTKEQNVRFEINTGVAEGAHLKLSSKLLGLARIVRTEP